MYVTRLPVGMQAVLVPVANHGRMTDNPEANCKFAGACYHCRMFNFGKPKTAGDWLVHIAGAIVAIFLIWWMLRMYVL